MSLGVARAELRKQVAFYLGWSRTSTDWDADQIDRIDSCVTKGLRTFYYPSGAPRGFSGWSFLNITGSLSITANIEDYDLPEGFGSLAGDMTWTDLPYPPVKQIPVDDLLQFRTVPTTYRPVFCAIRPKVSTGLAVQVREILFYPKPDSNQTLKYQYRFDPDNLSDTLLYPIGDQAHADTLFEACLAAAEQLEVDSTSTAHQQAFEQRKEASFRFDMVENRPTFFGAMVAYRPYGINRW